MLGLIAAVFVSSAWCETPPPTESESITKEIDFRRRNGHTKVISALAYTGDSKTLVAASFDGMVRLWDADATKVKRTIKTSSREVYAIAISPDDKWLITAGSSSEVQVWSLATGELHFALKGHVGPVPALAFSPNGTLLATGSYDKSIRIWDTTTWAEKLKITEGLDRVTSVAFSPDGKMLASAGTTVTAIIQIQVGQADYVRLWDVSTGKRMKELSIRGSQVAIAPDGRSIFASGLVLQVRREPDDVDIQGYAGLRWQSLEVNCTMVDTTGESRGCTFAHSRDWQWFTSTNGILTTLHFAWNIYSSDRADRAGFRLWESRTKGEAVKLARNYETKYDYETVAAFAPDGSRLAIGSFWGSLDVRSFRHDGKRPVVVADAQLALTSPEELWVALGSTKDRIPYWAIWQMLKTPDHSIEFLRGKLKAVSADELAVSRTRIRELADRDFRVRQKAMGELQKVSWSVLPLLRQEHERAKNPTARKALNDSN